MKEMYISWNRIVLKENMKKST